MRGQATWGPNLSDLHMAIIILMLYSCGKSILGPLPAAPTVRFKSALMNFCPGEIQQIMCQVVAYGRLKTTENFKQSSLKVVAKRGSIYGDFT